MDDDILNQLGEYLRRSGRNLARMPSGTYNALSDMASNVPHLDFAQDGITEYNGAITGYDTPYYGDDEISAAREYFDRKPRSNFSRLTDLVGNYMYGAATGPKAADAVRRALPKAAQPTEADSLRAIIDDWNRAKAEMEAARRQ